MLQNLFNRALRVLLATNALILLAGAMLGPIYALYVEELGGDLMDASMAGFLFAISAGLITLLSGRVSDRVRHSDLVLMSGYLIIALGFFLYQFTDTIAYLFLVQILIGIGHAVYSPAFDKLYSTHLDKGMDGQEWGAWESMNYFISALGAIGGGLLVTTFGFQMVFLIMALLSLSSGLYIYFLSPQRVL